MPRCCFRMAKYVPKRYSNEGTPTDQENRIADRFGGKRVSGSGASPYSKGDVRDVGAVTEDGEDIQFLVECKKTKHASLSVKWSWLTKISGEADDKGGHEPALAIEIQGGPNDPRTDRDWVMIPTRVFSKIKGAAEVIESGMSFLCHKCCVPIDVPGKHLPMKPGAILTCSKCLGEETKKPKSGKLVTFGYRYPDDEKK